MLYYLFKTKDLAHGCGLGFPHFCLASNLYVIYIFQVVRTVIFLETGFHNGVRNLELYRQIR